MRVLGVAFVGLLSVALLLTSASGTQAQQHSKGVDASRLEERYIGQMCQQAGLSVARGGEFPVCREPAVSKTWAVLVQAGMNDIDQRCDGYLAWLDDRRRLSDASHKQLTGRPATTAEPARAIAMVGIALGFGARAFDDPASRLLAEIPTLQSIVLTRQREFRAALPQSIDSRRAALDALRQYFRLCMPTTIKAQVKATVR